MRKAGTTGYYAAKVRNIIEISKKKKIFNDDSRDR
jgi:hypothetical protein